MKEMQSKLIMYAGAQMDILFTGNLKITRVVIYEIIIEGMNIFV